MLQHQLDLYMDMNEELTQELKATHRRIARLVADVGTGTRPATGGASMVVAKALLGAWTKNLGVANAQSTRLLGKQL